MAPGPWAVLAMLAALAAAEPCGFNPLCRCRRSHHEAVCRGVPFAHFPPLPADGIYQMSLTRSGLEVLHADALRGSSVASLHLVHNALSSVSARAFAGLEDLLTTLDLSHNALTEFPAAALRPLRQLQWLNLVGNRLDALDAGWAPPPQLHSLFLGANRLDAVPEGAFVSLRNLTLLDLDGNAIHDVGSRSLPDSLRTLSLANNILPRLPLHAVYALRHLRHLDASGNLLRRLPRPLVLSTPRLDKLDLGNNLLSHVPEGVFNGSLAVRELHLAFNFIRTVAAGSFRGTGLRRLVLANNRISALHTDAFAGVEATLAALDLGFNLMEHFPAAVGTLRALAHLSLKGNLLRRLDEGDLRGCRDSLETLDLSGNLLGQLPGAALRPLRRLVRLSLQDNRIEKIFRDDLEGWSRTLTTLSLANNRMTYLSGGAFEHLPQLKELKLSFNALASLDRNAFLPLRHTLEVLELSAALSPRSHPAETYVEALERLEWLQLDHNNASRASASSLRRLRRLVHLDLSNNELAELPADLFADHPYLSAVRLGSNEIGAVRAGTFDGLAHLSSVVLFGNGVASVESFAFARCPFLHTVVLSNNALSAVEPSAFHNLSRLSHLFLQHNRLEAFSLDAVSGDPSAAFLHLNLSDNCLRDLLARNDSAADAAPSLRLRTLDASVNRLASLSDAFVEAVSEHLTHLYLSHNRLEALSSLALPALQVLHLSHNAVAELGGELRRCPGLQVLLLDHNRLARLGTGAFGALPHLRVLDLGHNALASIAEDAFSGTRLERLNLSHNRLAQMPGLAPVRAHLRYLDLSANRIGEVPAASLPPLDRLHALNLSSNRLSALRVPGLHRLLELDASHNALDAFEAPPSLRALHLCNASLDSVPPLPLPRLSALALADNRLHNVSLWGDAALPLLLRLDVSGNRLRDAPVHLWGSVPRLAELDLSRNPIEALGVNSFAGLHRLRHLDIRGLALRRLDTRTLHGLRLLTTLSTDSYASVRTFRLQELVSGAPALRSVTLRVEESTLSHQVQGAFGPKLRELDITGRALRRVLPDAFAGLATHELVLRIRGTGVARLPPGLLRYLPDVRFLTLDLRRNRLASLAPAVLAAVAPGGARDDQQTHHITGGVLLEGNPWRCDCALLALGRWLRRWLRETFHLHLLGVEAALYVNGVARKATCVLGNATRAIVALRARDLAACGAGGASSAAPAPPSPAPPLLAGLTLVAVGNVMMCAPNKFRFL